MNLQSVNCRINKEIIVSIIYLINNLAESKDNTQYLQIILNHEQKYKLINFDIYIYFPYYKL